MHVPALNFNDSSSLYTSIGLGDGTSPLLTRLTTAMASNLEILSMRAVAPNITYHHEFVGPSLKCEPATGRRLDTLNSVWNASEYTVSRSDRGLPGVLLYLAYTMQEFPDGSTWLSFGMSSEQFVSKCLTGSVYPLCYRGAGPMITARVGNENIVCFPRATRFDITFQSSVSTQNVKTIEFAWLESIKGVGYDLDVVSERTATALATILNGIIAFNGPEHIPSDDRFAYEITTARTRLMSTALMGLVAAASDRAHLERFMDIPRGDRDLAANRTLADMIEELSRNQTLSLFSSERLW
jgi:hypothetical protein